MNRDAEIAGDDATFPLEPAWENRKEIGFFKSIVLTIRGVMFRPSETFSSFRWDGGYWNPILLCLLGGGASGVAVLFFDGFSIINGNFTAILSTLAGLLLGLGVVLASQFLFSGAVLVSLCALRLGNPSYQGIFRAVAYTSVLIDLLNAILGFAICVIMPKPLWDPAQSAICILLMIWQGCCITIGLSKMMVAPLWKPVAAVIFAMLLAYGCIEITSLNNPIGRKIWDGVYHAMTGNHFQP